MTKRTRHGLAIEAVASLVILTIIVIAKYIFAKYPTNRGLQRDVTSSTGDRGHLPSTFSISKKNGILNHSYTLN